MDSLQNAVFDNFWGLWSKDKDLWAKDKDTLRIYTSIIWRINY